MIPGKIQQLPMYYNLISLLQFLLTFCGRPLEFLVTRVRVERCVVFVLFIVYQFHVHVLTQLNRRG